MRRMVGAAILVAVAVLPRSGGLIRDGFENPNPPRADTRSAISSGATAADDPRTGPRGRTGTKQATNPPAEYLANPLKFLSLAPADSLALLPGIGPVIAERIANARTGKRLFTRWEDLLAVKGIGPKKLDRLKRLAGAANGN